MVLGLRGLLVCLLWLLATAAMYIADHANVCTYVRCTSSVS